MSFCPSPLCLTCYGWTDVQIEIYMQIERDKESQKDEHVWLEYNNRLSSEEIFEIKFEIESFAHLESVRGRGKGKIIVQISSYRGSSENNIGRLYSTSTRQTFNTLYVKHHYDRPLSLHFCQARFCSLEHLLSLVRSCPFVLLSI